MVLRWYTTDCLRDVALIRPGEGSRDAVQTWYHTPFIDHLRKAFPEGEGGCEADE